MTATLQIKTGRPNYFVLLRYYDEAGKRHQKWISTDIPVKGNNKRRAEKMREELLAQYNREEVDLGNDSYFIDFIKQWLATIKASKKIASTTFDAYFLTLNTHIIPYFEPQRLKVKEIEPKHIQRYVNHKMERLSPNTVKKHVANLSACMESAVRQNMIAFNPARRIEEIKKVKYTGAKFLNEEQITRLLDVSKDDPLEIVIRLTLFYGLRRSEVLGLKWDAIDFGNSTIAIKHTVVKVTKTTHFQDSTKNESSSAVMPIPNMIKTRLLQWKWEQERRSNLQPNDYVDSRYVCTMFDGTPIKPDYVSHHFRLVLEKNGLPIVRFHDLRHSSASYLKYLGFDLKDIQTWIRHADLRTTMNLYTHLDMAAKSAIAEKLDARIAELGL